MLTKCLSICPICLLSVTSRAHGKWATEVHTNGLFQPPNPLRRGRGRRRGLLLWVLGRVLVDPPLPVDLRIVAVIEAQGPLRLDRRLCVVSQGICNPSANQPPPLPPTASIRSINPEKAIGFIHAPVNQSYLGAASHHVGLARARRGGVPICCRCWKTREEGPHQRVNKPFQLERAAPFVSCPSLSFLETDTYLTRGRCARRAQSRRPGAEGGTGPCRLFMMNGWLVGSVVKGWKLG